MDALMQFVRARDAIWSLSVFDRLFRWGKCISVFQDYDNAHKRLWTAINEVGEAAAGEALAGSAKTVPLISMEEFEALLGKPPGTGEFRGGG